MMKSQKFIGPVLIKAVIFEMSYLSLVLHFAEYDFLFQESMAVDSFELQALLAGKGRCV